MNFPVGEVISKAYLPINLEVIIPELKKINFNGYLIQTIKGECIEEGVLFFRDGEINAVIVECLNAKKTFKGNEAIPYFLNQTKGNGFFQTISLTRSQVDLVTAFDEKLLVTNKIALKDLPKLIPVKFEDKFKLLSQESNVLDKYGLSGLKKS